MNDEAVRILKMVEEGKLTAEQAAGLLEAMGRKPEESGPRPSEPASTARRPEWIGIYVTDGRDGEQVRVKIPFGLVSCVEKFLPKGVMGKVRAGGKEIDLREFVSNLRSGMLGEVISVDAGDGTHVRIRCE